MNSPRAYISTSIRLDVKYHLDGHYEYQFMRPDRRKKNQRAYAKKQKWEWAIGSGGGNLNDWNDDKMLEANYDWRLSPIATALIAHLRYMKRQVKNATPKQPRKSQPDHSK